MNSIAVSIVGGSGYTGGELIRILHFHPNVILQQVSSERFAGKLVTKVHANLRKMTNLKFCAISEIETCDLLFLCLPHGKAAQRFEEFRGKAEKIIDLSADFRLNNPAEYESWYGNPHPHPVLLQEFVYGIPELHRDAIKNAKYVTGAGCNATAAVLGLYPLFKHDCVVEDKTVIEVKVGSSEAGNMATDASHHPERSGAVRSFKPTNHRHSAEMLQELRFGKDIQIHFSATAIEMVRGVLATGHVFLKIEMSEKEIWKLYRQEYGSEPFIRIVKDSEGSYRYPEPKLLAGTNYCDIGFEKDDRSERLVVISAIDNLMKGAAGQAVQAMNCMCGFDETTGLEFPGLHPI